MSEQRRNYLGARGMKMRIWLPALLILGFGCWILWKLVEWYAYSGRAFSGDGELTDTGFWSRPRYHLTLPEVRVGADGTCTFSFRGMPVAHFWFGLALDDVAQSDALDDLADRIRVNVELRDDRGKLLCATRAPMKAWARSWSQKRVLYWHEQCRDFVTRPDRRYTLVLTVEGDEGSSSAIRLSPILEGGGNETP